jgi:uncharacterized membrane protein
VCHQRPARSFHLWSVQLPVCARCTGLYVGCALTACLASSLAAGAGVSRPRLVLAVAAIPTAGTLVAEWMLHAGVSNLARAAAGVPLGAAVALIVLSGRGNGRTAPATALRGSG